MISLSFIKQWNIDVLWSLSDVRQSAPRTVLNLSLLCIPVLSVRSVWETFCGTVCHCLHSPFWSSHSRQMIGYIDSDNITDIWILISYVSECGESNNWWKVILLQNKLCISLVLALCSSVGNVKVYLSKIYFICFFFSYIGCQKKLQDVEIIIQKQYQITNLLLKKDFTNNIWLLVTGSNLKHV